MEQHETPIKKRFSPQQCTALADKFTFEDETITKGMDLMGMSIHEDSAAAINQFMRENPIATMDSVTPVLSPANSVPVQWLQFWNTPFRIMTAKRTSKELLGMTVVGNYATKQVVRPMIEGVGVPQEYTDMPNFPLANINKSFPMRNAVVFELGCFTGNLETKMDAEMKINALDQKRWAVANGLGIMANKIAFNGLAGRQTYGILNDPNLLPVQSVAPGEKGDTDWDTKTSVEIIMDVITAVAQLRTQTKQLFDPKRDAFTIGLPTNKIDRLDTPNAIGQESAYTYLVRTYPKMRIVGVPEFMGAGSAGTDLFYIIADEIMGEKTVDNFYTALLQLAGFEKKVKGLLEDYLTGVAGVLVNKPIGIATFAGI